MKIADIQSSTLSDLVVC